MRDATPVSASDPQDPGDGQGLGQEEPRPQRLQHGQGAVPRLPHGAGDAGQQRGGVWLFPDFDVGEPRAVGHAPGGAQQGLGVLRRSGIEPQQHEGSRLHHGPERGGGAHRGAAGLWAGTAELFGIDALALEVPVGLRGGGPEKEGPLGWARARERRVEVRLPEQPVHVLPRLTGLGREDPIPGGQLAVARAAVELRAHIGEEEGGVGIRGALKLRQEQVHHPRGMAPSPQPLLGEDAGDREAVSIGQRPIPRAQDAAGAERLTGGEHASLLVAQQPRPHLGAGPGVGPEPVLARGIPRRGERGAPGGVGEGIAFGLLGGGGEDEGHGSEAGGDGDAEVEQQVGLAHVEDGRVEGLHLAEGAQLLGNVEGGGPPEADQEALAELELQVQPCLEPRPEEVGVLQRVRVQIGVGEDQPGIEGEAHGAGGEREAEAQRFPGRAIDAGVLVLRGDDERFGDEGRGGGRVANLSGLQRPAPVLAWNEGLVLAQPLLVEHRLHVDLQPGVQRLVLEDGPEEEERGGAHGDVHGRGDLALRGRGAWQQHQQKQEG
ncbi:hypothetical protein STIAU_8185 [Stigmatella aurantiaca DW4/3-1]|uniref:Uncharacterized protein n=1 Tax=Stigmatella aurantiaca (strain DW4/3-1) TaxID=378806 RepID=Q08R71_STIAD|nr:hypothetical protein STIAU_8185 [Stigmatella aurantiaca DW4/3-1]